MEKNCVVYYFNPLPPHGGRHEVLMNMYHSRNFNPLPPHGGRLAKSIYFDRRKTFQSTPSAWRETRKAFILTGEKQFQSTPSAWRETSLVLLAVQLFKISIHSLRMEGDDYARLFFQKILYFNPLPPHGGRHGRGFRITLICNFNPLPPHGGRQQNCTGKRFSFRLSLYNPAKKDAKDYILHPKK